MIMKTLSLFVAAFGSAAHAFPHMGNLMAGDAAAASGPQILARQASISETNCGPTPCLIFDEQEQFVNVAPGSSHQYVAPGPGDIRGPCPGLNAAANHGFLPHNGIPNIIQSKQDLLLSGSPAEMENSHRWLSASVRHGR